MGEVGAEVRCAVGIALDSAFEDEHRPDVAARAPDAVADFEELEFFLGHGVLGSSGSTGESASAAWSCSRVIVLRGSGHSLRQALQ